MHKSRREGDENLGRSFSWLRIRLRGISSNSHDSRVLLITSAEQNIVHRPKSVLNISSLKSTFRIFARINSAVSARVAHGDFCLLYI